MSSEDTAAAADQAPPRFPQLEVDAPAERAEALGYLLFELGASGVEERDGTTLAKGPGEGQVTLVASFGELAAAQRAAEQLAADEPGLELRVSELVGDAWRDKYKEHFAPFALTASVTVVPPWVDQPPAADKLLWMDPGRAFGTGLHATTSLVAQALERHRDDLQGARLLDVGTGSGVLALAALLLGADSAVAVDNDPVAVEVARQNVARNGLETRVDASETPLAQIGEVFPIVVANIEARVLMPMAAALCARLAPGGLLILSGVLAGEEPEVRGHFVATVDGLEHCGTDRRDEGDDAWTALCFRASRGRASAGPASGGATGDG